MTAFIFGLCVIGIILQGIFIVVEHKEKYVPAVILKGLASVIFCIIGYIALTNGATTEAGNTFIKSIFIGLILGAIGDILLGLRFVFEKIGQKIFLAGIASFLAGHILYLVALIPLSSSIIICTILGLVVSAIILTIIFKVFDVKLAFKIFGVLYISAVVVMTFIAGGNCITSGFEKNALVYAIGAILFMVSDIVMIFNTFGNTSRFSLRITNLTLYYFGQLLIASSLFLL